MLDFIKNNTSFLFSFKNNNIDTNLINIIIEKLKENRLITITGFKWSWKTNLISYIITKSNFKDSFLYINKSLDLNNIIKNKESLEKLLNSYIENLGKPKIIILENIALIPKIKEFINFLYKQNYKIIIIWNNIKIWNKPEIEVNKSRQFKFNLIEKNLEETEKLKTENIIFEDIIKTYSLKYFDLYKYTLIFLSKLNSSSSIREINRNLNNSIKISLVTMMEYLKYSIKAKIINSITVFDFKKNKEIITKTKYYFTDTNFRNSLYNFELDTNILKENLLFTELKKSGYKINSWINWSYNFDFYTIKVIQNKENIWYKINTIFIDFCKNTDKKEIKKQINKLLKVPELPYIPENKSKPFNQTFSKYIILENPSEIWIKKLEYENLKIISLNELLKLI